MPSHCAQLPRVPAAHMARCCTHFCAHFDTVIGGSVSKNRAFPSKRHAVGQLFQRRHRRTRKSQWAHSSSPDMPSGHAQQRRGRPAIGRSQPKEAPRFRRERRCAVTGAHRGLPVLKARLSWCYMTLAAPAGACASQAIRPMSRGERTKRR